MPPLMFEPLLPRRLGPVVCTATAGSTDLARVVTDNQHLIVDRLAAHGAVLLRGFSVTSDTDFQRAVAALPFRPMDYVYRSTPRTARGEGVFTTTEYPASESIPLHCENAYSRSWPSVVAFCCLTPATSGGETPLAYVREVTATIPGPIVAKFEGLGVRYVRHYMPHVDIPWQTVFQTDDPAAVADFCQANGIACRWLDEEVLETSQDCQGTIRHPVSGERLFFNQAHLFHVSSLSLGRAQEMLELFGPDRLPRHARFGDGTEIPAQDLVRIRQAYELRAFKFVWRQGDVLLVDNLQLAHGRSPFTGSRMHLAALLADAPGQAWRQAAAAALA